MIALKSIQLFVGLLTLFIAYLLAIAPAGYFRAWVAKKMGDDTAERLGFLTLNPLEHIDIVGLICLFLFSRPEYFSGWGWGKHVPINPLNIHGKHRGLKLGIAFFSDTFAYIAMAVIALVVGAFLFDPQSMLLSAQPSLSVMLVRLILAFVGLNISLALIMLVFNAVLLVAFYITHTRVQNFSYMQYLVLFAPLIILLLFGNEIRQLIVHGVLALQKLIAGGN